MLYFIIQQVNFKSQNFLKDFLLSLLFYKFNDKTLMKLKKYFSKINEITFFFSKGLILVSH